MGVLSTFLPRFLFLSFSLSLFLSFSLSLLLSYNLFFSPALHIAEKGFNSINHHNRVHKFIPMPQAMKILDAKAAVEKEKEKLQKMPERQLNEVRCCCGSTKRKKKVHFATLMDICHPKNAELEPKYQKYKGRVVLRGEIVQDDSGAYAALTVQGSSASQMTAAQVMHVIARLPDCAGQAADAVSAYTQVKMEDAPRLLKIPGSECPHICIRLPRHK